jgi:hypothetical protein
MKATQLKYRTLEKNCVGFVYRCIDLFLSKTVLNYRITELWHLTTNSVTICLVRLQYYQFDHVKNYEDTSIIIMLAFSF